MTTTEDAAVVMPNIIQRGIPILAAVHTIISSGLLCHGIPWLISSNNKKEQTDSSVKEASKPCRNMKWIRLILIVYFTSCAFMHLILACYRCLVVSHGTSFYSQSILYQLNSRNGIPATSPFQNTTKVAKFWMEREISESSVFRYDLYSGLNVVTSNVEKLAMKQISNEWSRLLLNVGMCILDLVTAVILFRSWKPQLEIKRKETSPIKEKV